MSNNRIDSSSTSYIKTRLIVMRGTAENLFAQATSVTETASKGGGTITGHGFLPGPEAVEKVFQTLEFITDARQQTTREGLEKTLARQMEKIGQLAQTGQLPEKIPELLQDAAKIVTGTNKAGGKPARCP